MKKTNRIIAALVSAIITSAIPVGLNVFASNLPVYNSEDLGPKLEGYTKIEDAKEIEHPEYKVEYGVSYYINDRKQVKIVVTYPNYFMIEFPLDMDENVFEEKVHAVYPEAIISRANGYVETKAFEVTTERNKNISIDQAKAIYKQFEENALNFKFHYCGLGLGTLYYTFGYHGYADESKNNTSDLTIYKGIEKKDKLQAYIDESDVKCHIEIDEKENIVDIVPDVTLSYAEEITLASKIYKATGYNSEWAMLSTTAQGAVGKETIIDMHNAVTGDANCDNQLDMADAVLIMQSLANPDKYQLTAQGSFNADTNDDGITVGDAQIIQEILLGLN